MFRTKVYVYDYTSNGFIDKKEKEIKNDEVKVKSFAISIENKTKLNDIVQYAEELGLTSGNLGYADYFDYLTFGVDSTYDISYKGYHNLPKGVEKIDSIYTLQRRIEKMADKKANLTVEDYLRIGYKTYRELALGKPSRKSTPKKTRKPQTRSRCICDIDSDIMVSDHYIVTDGYIAKKYPNDTVRVCFDL